MWDQCTLESMFIPIPSSCLSMSYPCLVRHGRGARFSGSNTSDLILHGYHTGVAFPTAQAGGRHPSSAAPSCTVLVSCIVSCSQVMRARSPVVIGEPLLTVPSLQARRAALFSRSCTVPSVLLIPTDRSVPSRQARRAALFSSSVDVQMAPVPLDSPVASPSKAPDSRRHSSDASIAMSTWSVDRGGDAG